MRPRFSKYLNLVEAIQYIPFGIDISALAGLLSGICTISQRHTCTAVYSGSYIIWSTGTFLAMTGIFLIPLAGSDIIKLFVVGN